MVQSDHEEVEARTDAELLEELAQVGADGDRRNRFSRELWGRHWPMLKRYLARRFPGVGRDTPEAAAATTLNALLLNPTSYDPARGKLGPYLRTIAYRQLVDLLDQRQNRVPIDSVVIPISVEEDWVPVQKDGFADVIAMNMLDDMTEADRTTVRLVSRGYRHA